MPKWRMHAAKRNADMHLEREKMGREVVAVTQGRRDLGTWEQIFYGGPNGRRRDRVLPKISSE